MLLRKSLSFLLLTLLTAPALAAGPCETEIEANDAMQFNKASIDVPKSCKQFKVTLKHTGKLAKNAMGHNWVLAKTADVQGVANEGMTAGLDKNYVKAGDIRVIAHTKVVGGGESDAVTIDVAKLKAGEAYSYVCTFPGHAAIMKGTLQLK